MRGGLISCLNTKGVVLEKDPEQVLYSDSAFSLVQNFSRGQFMMTGCVDVFILYKIPNNTLVFESQVLHVVLFVWNMVLMRSGRE